MKTGHRKHLPYWILLLVLTAGQAFAVRVYVNPSIQTSNVSPDRTYNEGYSMQDVASRLMSKLTNRGFEARNSQWLSLSSACNDADTWNANCFVALHTNASGGGGWSSAHGTDGFYYQSSSGWYDPKDLELSERCVHKCVQKFNQWGRGYDRGSHGDYSYMGYNFYVLSHTPDMNAVLIEGLFHTNEADTAVLKTAEGKDAYAQAIYEAVCDYYGWSYITEIWNSAYNAKSFPASMTAGQQAVCWIEYQNTGNTTWTNSGANPVNLGTRNPQDRVSAFFTSGDWINNKRPTGMDSASCAPNETARFTFTITAPQQTGIYTETWRLVSEGKSWFGDSSVAFNITVNPPKARLTGKVTSSADGSLLYGARVTLNTGASILTETDGTYSFDNLNSGTFIVTVSKSYYKPTSTFVTTAVGSTTTRDFSLDRLVETFSTADDFVRIGWNLVSLPATPVNPDPTVILTGINPAESGLQYWRSDSGSGAYQAYGEAFGWTGPMVVGVPYWFMETNAQKGLLFSGYRNLKDWEIQVPAHSQAPYWIMLGQPFEHATECSSIRFSTPSHATPLAWGDACRAGIVESTASGYDAANSRFFSAGPGEFMAERTSLEPWLGYWLMLRTTEPVTITIPVSL